MRTFTFQTHEKLKINGFLELEFVEYNEKFFLNKLFKIPSVSENIKKNGGYYFNQINGIMVLGLLSDIGKQPHPAIELAYACSWYNSNLGGVYLIGFDKAKNEYFAPIKKSR